MHRNPRIRSACLIESTFFTCKKRSSEACPRRRTRNHAGLLWQCSANLGRVGGGVGVAVQGAGVTKPVFTGRSESPIRRSPKSHHSTPSDLNSPRVCCSSLMPRARARLVHSRLGSPTVWSTFSQAASAEQEKGSNLYKTNRGKYIVSA